MRRMSSSHVSKTHERATAEGKRKAPLDGSASLKSRDRTLAQTVLGFGDVPLEILNHLRAKLLRDLLSRDGPSPLRADMGAHSHVHTTQRRGLH
jgi:hypothetical protein